MLFRDAGFNATSTRQIAVAANVSKRTIYEHFANKHAILEVVLSDYIRARFSHIHALNLPSDDAYEALLLIATEMRRAATDPNSAMMVRLQIAESFRLPEVSGRLDDLGRNHAIALLQQPLEALGVEQAILAAEVAYDLLVLVPVHRLLLGASAPQTSPRAILDMILGSGFIDRAEKRSRPR